MSPEPLPDVLAIALDMASHLESVDVRYVIGGSLANSVHGEPISKPGRAIRRAEMEWETLLTAAQPSP